MRAYKPHARMTGEKNTYIYIYMYKRQGTNWRETSEFETYERENAMYTNICTYVWSMQDELLSSMQIRDKPPTPRASVNKDNRINYTVSTYKLVTELWVLLKAINNSRLPYITAWVTRFLLRMPERMYDFADFLVCPFADWGRCRRTKMGSYERSCQKWDERLVWREQNAIPQSAG